MFCTEHKQVYLFKKSASYTLEQALGGEYISNNTKAKTTPWFSEAKCNAISVTFIVDSLPKPYITMKELRSETNSKLCIFKLIFLDLQIVDSRQFWGCFDSRQCLETIWHVFLIRVGTLKMSTDPPRIFIFDNFCWE